MCTICGYLGKEIIISRVCGRDHALWHIVQRVSYMMWGPCSEEERLLGQSYVVGL